MIFLNVLGLVAVAFIVLFVFHNLLVASTNMRAVGYYNEARDAFVRSDQKEGKRLMAKADRIRGSWWMLWWRA